MPRELRDWASNLAQTNQFEEAAYRSRLELEDVSRAEAICTAEYSARTTWFDRVLKLIHWDQS